MKSAPEDPTHCHCGKAAVYFRRNEGRHYCASCLSSQVERRFQKAVRSMINPDDTIAIGVSGGKDSMALLHLMMKLSKKVPVKLTAITIDEGIEGYRDRGIETVSKFAEANGIEHRIFSFHNEFGTRTDLIKEKHCTACGVFRRRLLNKKARELGANKLALGHNLDDEAQSVMMNVMRGDLLRMGAQKTKEGLVQRIKPLKNIPEKEILAYALINQIPYFDGECPFSFDNVRRDVQTVINDLEDRYPGTKHNIVRFHRKIRENIPGREGKIARCRECGEPSSAETCKVCEIRSKMKAK